MHNELARFTKEYDIDDVMNSPVVSDPLRLLDICATSDGGAALVVCSMEYAKAHGHTDPVRIAGLSTVTPVYPDTVIDLPYMATDSAGATPEPLRGFKQSIGDKVYEESGLGPDDVDVAEVYDLSSSLELDWYEQLGFCAEGEAEKLLRDGVTEIGGRLPVNRPAAWVHSVRPSPPRRSPSVRAHVAASGRRRQTPGRGCPRRHLRQPGPVRARFVGVGAPMTIHQSVTAEGVLELVMDNPKVNALPIVTPRRSPSCSTG